LKFFFFSKLIQNIRCDNIFYAVFNLLTLPRLEDLRELTFLLILYLSYHLTKHQGETKTSQKSKLRVIYNFCMKCTKLL